ncbi:hypothetical protein ACG3SL_03250 [Sphingomonas sp. CJ20]
MSKLRLPFTAHQIKLAAFVGAWFAMLCAYPIWHHHVITRLGPVLPTQQAAQRWLSGFEAGEGHACLRWASDDKVEPVPGAPGYYASIRCNTPQVFMREGVAFLLPALVVLLAVAFFRSGKPRPAKRRGTKRR